MSHYDWGAQLPRRERAGGVHEMLVLELLLQRAWQERDRDAFAAGLAAFALCGYAPGNESAMLYGPSRDVVLGFSEASVKGKDRRRLAGMGRGVLHLCDALAAAGIESHALFGSARTTLYNGERLRIERPASAGLGEFVLEVRKP